ncbi:activator of Hsp90 ATPase [Rhodofomes roseus]|uniref:Activator of Hsp90 ATPase n=1 Tax=Rhodofomes roseus TaxID=34475 RepID=A0ABQ8K753_9APHY|nr:activator of Hsp90 ATPase [Rhodofomes roseus]KAH9832879.1 activator of Hsp90 ATPase [Rhodofomes roseus]
MAAVPPPMPTSTANWHWKNKTVTPWARAWFERELVTVEVSGEGEEKVGVTKLNDFEGDVELGQRKSKLITIYDCKVELQWAGTASDGSEVTGKLTVPEVSHEITLDGLSDYVYHWSLTSPSSPQADALLALAKKSLPAALEKKFAEFAAAIIDTHGKDLQVSSSSAEPSRQGTPAPPATSAPASSGSAKPSTSAPAKAAPKVNSTSVSAEANFMAAAADLFDLLTNEKRIPMWTRAPAVSAAQPGAEYSLFGGGVKGKYVSLTPPKEIVQSWALSSPTWPDGHVATLTTTLDQGSDSTKVSWRLEGVPLGTEEEIQRNLQGYYIHGLKSIGLGTEL